MQRTFLFRRVPVTAGTIGQLDLLRQDGVPSLRMDWDGDGTIDSELLPAAGFSGEEPWEAPIDIKPGSLKNPVDAKRVDPRSVSFGRGGAVEVHGRGHWEDIDGVGDVDLVLHFNAAEAGILPDDTAVCMTGTLTSGERFQGCDGITLVH